MKSDFMKLFEATCKICGKPLTLEIDDSYDSVADPFKLLPLATCNRCFDLRERQKRIADRLSNFIGLLLEKPSVKSRNAIRPKLVSATRDYCDVLLTKYGKSANIWDEAMVDALMDQPEKFKDVINRIHVLAKGEELLV